MQVKPLSSGFSLDSSSQMSLHCSSSSLFSEFGEAGPVESVEGTLPLVLEEEDEFSENFTKVVTVDDSEHFPSEIFEPLSEEVEGELSSDSSESALSPAPWVRTASGRPGKILQFAEDEYETVALIEMIDGKQQFRSQESYRLSTELTQRLVISPSGNYGNYVPNQTSLETKSLKKSESDEEKCIPTNVSLEEEEKGGEHLPAPVPFVMDRFGNFVPATALEEPGQCSAPQKQLRFQFAEEGKGNDSRPIPRQVTRHTNAIQ
jgi:hypothetical protein